MPLRQIRAFQWQKHERPSENCTTRLSDGLWVAAKTACAAAPHTLPWRHRQAEQSRV
ncbi:hypothetical protein HMPREF9123_1722 [Neisseria bacilliformis ATCC BAA-1200]|uniref:Uncharacterized protein n=1 Tax=Neisseria bacilliformis ATCC BAA-1200 TaxID=888742 RepID=F2BDB6_9NEIS|nr:hypothetical protein HMPREF9123_1722 [Neisseria bacilliformis ATCC BAA-1200]